MQTNQNQQRVSERELETTLKTIEDTLNASLTNSSDFIQYIGNEVLSTYDGNPVSAAHLFTHDFSVDNKLNSFYAWTLLSWVNAEGKVVITPAGIRKQSTLPEHYPLAEAKAKSWTLRIGDVASRDGYPYLPAAMSIESDQGNYVGTIITDLLPEKLQRDIHHRLGQSYATYHFLLWDEQGNVLIDSLPAQHFPGTFAEMKYAPDTHIPRPQRIDGSRVMQHQFIWGNRHFYLGLTFASNTLPSMKFWQDFLPHFYLACALTVIFLLLIYIFRKRTILPVIGRLKSNLKEEIAARKEKDRFLEQILSGITGFIYRHSIKENEIICEYVSEGCTQLTGYAPAQYFGESRIKHSDVIHPDYLHKVMQHIKEAIQHNKAFEISYPIITSGGVTKWVLNQGHPITHDAFLFEGLLTDITEMKQTEKRMEETLRALKLSNSELEEFAYACSHDLKEPLRTIFSYIQLYKRERNVDYLTYIENSTLRMKYLIENILLYSQLGINAPVNREVTSLKQLVEYALHILSASISEAQATITIEPTHATVIGDREQLYRLFQNLLSNALKFRMPGMPPHITIGAELQDGHMWRIHVSDDGIGIPTKFHEKIFDLFSRLHSQDQYPGSGFGLTLCKKIVERHGGCIWVESQENKGATFFITLPAAT